MLSMPWRPVSQCSMRGAPSLHHTVLVRLSAARRQWPPAVQRFWFLLNDGDCPGASLVTASASRVPPPLSRARVINTCIQSGRHERPKCGEPGLCNKLVGPPILSCLKSRRSFTLRKPTQLLRG